MADRSLFSELAKRKVVQSAAIYGAIAWGVTEVVVTVVDQLFLPQWISTLAVIFFVVGFPVAMFLSWTFDFTAEGIHRTTVSSRKGTTSIAVSLFLLVAGTTGLFFLIKPGLEVREVPSAPLSVAPNSLAVLPFVNAAGNDEDTYLIEGLSDELRDQLARVSGLRLAARSSSVAALEQGLDALTASTKLGVANLIEGNVRRQGNILRVSVQLIEGSSGLAIWSDTFERGPRELVSVQQAIAEAVVNAVLPESKASIAEPATRDATANELMLLARHYEQRARERQDVDEATLIEAVRLYRQATEADPESALAHSRLAGALLYLGDLDAAEAPIFKALSVNSNLSEVQNTLGEFHWARGLVTQAGVAWARAVELNPNNPQALSNYARSLWYNIEVEKGVREMLERAVSLDPLSLEPYATLGGFLALENHPEGARAIVARVEELFDGAAAYSVMAQLWSYLGEVDKSIAWTLRARDLEPDTRAHIEKLAEYYAELGDFETALKLDPNGIGILFQARRYREMLDLAEFVMLEEPHDLHLRALMAIANNALGRFESAINVLRNTGLPDSVFNGWRSGAEWDGYNALMNALYGAGELELARELAQFGIDFGDPVNVDWWVNIYAACDFVIVGRHDMAREYLGRVAKGYRLPWDPVLKDLPCFDQLSGEPAYWAAVRHFGERRAMLRERLPATLEEFSVEL